MEASDWVAAVSLHVDSLLCADISLGDDNSSPNSGDIPVSFWLCAGSSSPVGPLSNNCFAGPCICAGCSSSRAPRPSWPCFCVCRSFSADAPSPTGYASPSSSPAGQVPLSSFAPLTTPNASTFDRGGHRGQDQRRSCRKSDLSNQGAASGTESLLHSGRNRSVDPKVQRADRIPKTLFDQRCHPIPNDPTAVPSRLSRAASTAVWIWTSKVSPTGPSRRSRMEVTDARVMASREDIKSGAEAVVGSTMAEWMLSWIVRTVMWDSETILSKSKM